MSRPNDASVRYIPPQYQNYNYNEQLSRSRSRSPPSRSRRDSRVSFEPTPVKEPKAWYKKKTLWASLASVASIAALVPIAYSAHGSLSSAKGSNRSADASHRAADAVEKSSKAAIRSADAAEHSAEASEKAAVAALRSASAVEKSSKATVLTAMANGHMDAEGNYIPPAKPKAIQAPIRDQRLLDYEPLRKVFNAADMVTGHAKAR
ncbi:uncharacterized protein MYCFIDRAFT_78250 [Pseudocercospora fijiensis CIRAD86]|uniref:Uncharacterized protein n=1 Tax=Pseudocercospora fijiensis (strain CIRAD86) TaxID=383855 RepID=M3ASS0_PSEFD|nr:uncharacterized protein MYCFIDRAFT_78250 [Pseudocercospora fijiensis CIRAD86]EME80542.1 hypothetical protein MYCFIDRAFT_78250 [Pseudocercospora fijiensis CIRAD86]